MTHQGEVPHLEVIVEDKQLSLAIGKKGQNVRLAAKLTGWRIDIKSESDVKDEVADALARMLQTALGGPAPGARPSVDVGLAPGVSAEIADRLRDAGLGTPEEILEAGEGELQGVEGVDADLADGIVAWAETWNEEQAARAQADIGKTFRAPEASSSMGDEDFMAALSRAFQESEQQRASVQWPGEEPDAAAGTADETEEPSTRENE